MAGDVVGQSGIERNAIALRRQRQLAGVLLLQRYSPDAGLDEGFGDKGTLTIDVAGVSLSPREVLLQFLVEAVVLSSLGGLVGIVLANLTSVGLAELMQVPFLFNPGVNLLAFGFSAAIGVFFGFYPARKAASLDPIEALRYE